jgi:pimeloyl-ACP methyl ester carboxylesterase
MPTLRRWTQRVFAILCGLLAGALLVGFTYEQLGRAHENQNLPPRIGNAIDIGGRTINLFCTGEGSPTVIFESGGNGPGYEWTPIQAKVATFTRACWYDRAGVGWSDPPSSPRTSTSIVNDLHETLGRARIPPPYVMVGASAGGDYVRIYTARYPHDVVGLVLLDSSHPDQQEPAFMLSPINRMSQAQRHLICSALPFMTRFGVLRLRATRMGLRGGQPTSPEQQILANLNAQPKAEKTDAEQACAATDAGRVLPTRGSGNPEIDAAARNAGGLGDRPLVVLTAGKYWSPPGLEKEAAEYHEVWVHQLQASLARLSTRGRQVVVDAHHDMDGASETIVSATREVVDEVRHGS